MTDQGPRARIAQNPTSKTSPGREELERDVSLRRDQVATRLPVAIRLSTSAHSSRIGHAARMQITSQNNGNQNATSPGVAMRTRPAPLSRSKTENKPAFWANH
ncbi:hypothetical protein Taro_035114, partial [Colocasia esculenta]|nr:hypothetical protein [Colocasia esculenta]